MAVVVAVNCFLAKFCSAFGGYLTLGDDPFLLQRCQVVRPLERSLLQGFATAWRPTASSSASWAQVLVASICWFFMAPEACCRVRAACWESWPVWLPSCCASSFLGSAEADGRSREVGPGVWLRMTQDKTRQDEPQVSRGPLNVRGGAAQVIPDEVLPCWFRALGGAVKGLPPCEELP